MQRFHFLPLLKIAAAAATAAFTFPLLVLGCADDASTENRPVDQAKEKTKTPKKPEDPSDPLPPSAITGDEDDGTTPADRPAPSTDGSIRECANEPVQTDAVKVVKEFVLPETFTARLGMGTRVNDSGLKGVLSTTWATGYSASDADFGTGEVTYTGGTRDAIVLTSMLLGKNFAQVNDTFKVKVGDTTPVQAWSANLAPTGKRLTMVTGASAQKGSWHLNLPTRTSAAPTTGAEYVSTVKGRRFFAYKIALEVDSLCKIGKINDVLGKVVDDPTHVLSAGREAYGTGGAIPADPKKRAAMQDVLLKTGAKLTFSVLANKHRASVAALLDRTSCSSANLDACEELARALSEEMIFWRDAGTTSSYVSYESVVSGTDPNFSVIDFEAAALR